ncbi:hypothetical protein BZG36_03339 [Bifiguratus adelaidae]|uniref:PH domain-containing protein n=1 Tax=Bifiguratus adelaidae TaxID=1938954 RepID=A0A261XWR9_9FUNG|nr:hypothetical protein BZG36_03339 [Bifiguratus adelaidae]
MAKQGEVEKQSSGLRKSWRKRYMVLRGGELLIYNAESDAFPQSVVVLERYASVHIMPGLKNRPFCFVLMPRYATANIKQLLFSVASYEEMDSWISAIQSVWQHNEQSVLDKWLEKLDLDVSDQESGMLRRGSKTMLNMASALLSPNYFTVRATGAPMAPNGPNAIKTAPSVGSLVSETDSFVTQSSNRTDPLPASRSTQRSSVPTTRTTSLPLPNTGNASTQLNHIIPPTQLIRMGTTGLVASRQKERLPLLARRNMALAPVVTKPTPMPAAIPDSPTLRSLDTPLSTIPSAVSSASSVTVAYPPPVVKDCSSNMTTRARNRRSNSAPRLEVFRNNIVTPTFGAF